MKNKMKLSITAFVLFFISTGINSLNAQTDSGDKKFVEIKTSAICGTCKATIEKAVNAVEGVKSASLDLKTKTVTVTYYADKTTTDQIKNAIVNAGYDADELTADPGAYEHLDGCCKKE